MPPNCPCFTGFLQLKVEDTILKFNKMHEELDVMPSSTSYEKLVKYSCDSNEVFLLCLFYNKFGCISCAIYNEYSLCAVGSHCS